jgi:hypothetical protein
MSRLDEALRKDLARAISFALNLRIVNRDARKAIRGLPESAVDYMADNIAEHLLLSGWHHRPRSETDFAGPGFMSDLPRRAKPWPRGDSEPEDGGQA